MEQTKIKISGFSSLNTQTMQALTLLYAPLIKNEAIFFYTLLISLQDQMEISYHELMLLMQKTYLEIKHLKGLLEEYRLLRTYTDPNDEIHYFDLQKPLEALNFLNHNLFARILHAKVDAKIFQSLQKMFQPHNQFQHLIETTQIIDLGLEINAIEQLEDIYQNVAEWGIQHQFDYATFIKLAQPLSIPQEFIENKNILHRIGELAYIYSIDVSNMAKYVAKATKLADKTLDFEKLIQLISKAKITINADLIHPLQHLKTKQNGIEPIAKDKKLIQKLIVEYRFSFDLINLLLDYSLEKNQQRIIANYIETIAASWIRKNITTLEAAKQTLHEKQTVKSRKEVMVESWKNHKPLEVDHAILDEIRKGK